METAALYAAGTNILAGIAKAITPSNPAEQVGSGIIGNWADRVLLNGLLRSVTAWQCFQKNCQRLDPRENHILFRALLSAHWRAVAQVIAVYGRGRSIPLASASDSVSLPKRLRAGVRNWFNTGAPRSLAQVADAQILREALTLCDQNAQAPNLDLSANWNDVLDPLYGELSSLMQQGRTPSQGPGEKAWQALQNDFSALAQLPGFREFFLQFWFDFFSVNFQLLTQDPHVAPLLIGKLFADIRERDGDAPLAAGQLMAAFQEGFAGVHEHLSEIHTDVLRAIDESLGRQSRTPVREPKIGLLNTHQAILGRDDEAQTLLAALQQTGPSVLSIATPPGFGRAAWSSTSASSSPATCFSSSIRNRWRPRWPEWWPSTCVSSPRDHATCSG